MKTATLIGISPLEFWEITPYELSLMAEAHVRQKTEDTKEKITMAYLTAMWTIQWLGKRHSHPKPLKEILESIGKEKKAMTDEQMYAIVKQLDRSFSGKGVNAGAEE